MRNCRRCKDSEAEKGSLNCEKCNERSERHNAKLIAESKSLAYYGAYGGLGREADKAGFDYSAYHFD